MWGQDYTWDTVIHMEKGPEVDRVDQLNDDTKPSSDQEDGIDTNELEWSERERN